MIQAGKVLNGRYKLLRPLGQGSQAFVWAAEHLALGSQVAVKLIDPELAKQEDARERFAREATAAAKLRSAHVVQMLDHGIDGDQPFIVMELLEGQDLFDRLQDRQRLTITETSKILTQVARALMRAHAEGIIHRDLKPENVFLVKNDDEEFAKVLDFGVAKVTTPAKAAMTRTGVGTLIGTPHYMSPEQVKGLTEIDHRSDLWSLGIIGYQCVTGQLPFDSEGVGDLLIKITMSTPRLPSSLFKDLPPAFDAWFKRACAKEPGDRFQTAREMADALARSAGTEVPNSTRGPVVVNLDASDLDWGSLAGLRPAAPARPLPPPVPGRGAISKPREETLDGNDAIEVTEGSRPPPPPPPPRSSRTPTPPRAAPEEPPPSSRGIEDNPFLAAPVSSSSPPVSRGPASGRSLQSTVTGLASTSDREVDAPPEFDGSRKRRAGWFVAVALVVSGAAVAVGVLRSRGGFEPAAAPAPPRAPTAAPTPERAAALPVATEPTGEASAAPSASSAPSAEAATDPMVTKKPTPASAAPVSVPRPKRPGNEAVEIEVPDPDREIRLPRGQ